MEATDCESERVVRREVDRTNPHDTSAFGGKSVGGSSHLVWTNWAHQQPRASGALYVVDELHHGSLHRSVSDGEFDPTNRANMQTSWRNRPSDSEAQGTHDCDQHREQRKRKQYCSDHIQLDQPQYSASDDGDDPEEETSPATQCWHL